MGNKNLLIWASDLSENTGEGILARTFLFEIQKIIKYETVKIKTLESSFNINQLNINKIKFQEIDKKTIYHKYFGPIYGAIYLLFFSRKYAKKIGKRLNDYAEKLNNILISSFHNFVNIKIYNKTGFFLKKYQIANVDFADNQKKMIFLYSLYVVFF